MTTVPKQPLFRLGGLDIVEPLGEGAMGAVWSARHPSSHELLAVKVVSLEQNRSEFTRALAREVRAMARLPHENIVSVIGHGRVTENEAEAAPGRLVNGAPWFAMEQMSASLADRVPRDWSSIREAARQILRGLAFAHARSVIHRDLKPSNVLLARRDGRVRYAIADFGIAHVRDERDMKSAQLRRVVGTPLYMAPEQYAGQWRDFGPWTDLYALGCMLFEMVYGRPPFRGDSLVALAQQHMTAAVPSLTARFDVPDEVDSWLRCLLAKAPERRPACAADALATLPDGSVGSDLSASAKGEPGIGATTLLLDPIDFQTTIEGEPLRFGTTSVDDAPTLPAAPIPPVPPEGPEPSLLTGELGASLFELRPPPTVGRDRDRIQLWADLHRVAASGAFARILSGPETSAGDLLMQQFARLAVEAGSARWLECTPRRGGDRVIVAALARLLGTQGLEPEQLAGRLAFCPLSSSWSAEHRARLAALLGTDLTGRGVGMGTHAARERLSTIRETLRALAADRPLLVTLEDAHIDDLEAVEGLLDDEVPEPLLFVGWVSDQTRSRMEGWAKEAFSKLEAHPRSETTSLAALSQRDCVAWVRRNVQLGPDAIEIAGRTELGPAMTTHLLGHWIRTGELRWAEDGFETGGGVRPPSDVEELWQWRLSEVDSHLDAISMAAALGRVVALREWTQLRATLGVEEAITALEALAERGMGTFTADHFTFVSERLRQQVLDRLPGEERCAIHGQIADKLDLPLRRELHHLLDGERYDDVLLTLGNVWAPGMIAETVDPVVLGIGQQALRRLGPAVDELVAARVQRHLVRRLRMEGKLKEALRLNQHVLDVAHRENDWRLEADCLVRGAGFYQLQGDFEAARTGVQRTIELLEPRAADEPRMYAVALLARGMIEADAGNLADGIADLERARALMRHATQGDARATVNVGLGSLLVRAERYDDAMEALDEAIEVCEAIGSRLVLGRTLNMMGDVERGLGELFAAREHFERACRALAEVGGDDVAYPMFNLAILDFDGGDHDAAEAGFAEVAAIASRCRAARLHAAARTGVAAVQVRRGKRQSASDWDEIATLVDQGLGGKDVSELLETAAAELRARGAEQVAARVLEIAAASWRRMGRDDRADSIAP